MSVASPLLLIAGIVAALAAVALAWRRRGVAILLGLAVLAGCAAAAGVSLKVGRPAAIVVLVDASPSTRGLWFRDAQRVREIAARTAPPGTTLSFLTFAAGQATPMGDSVAERPVERTTLPAVEADAILLMSDGQFDAPSPSTITPVFPVITPAEQVTDARITGVERAGGRIIVGVANTGPARTINWPDGETSAVPTGSVRLAHDDRAGIVRIGGGDRWPENDAVALGPAIALASERWWIGGSPPAVTRAVDPAQLPSLEAWLAARSVVINDVPAGAFSSAAQQTLCRYVRDLGGSLILVGGANGFSAGGYGGTELDGLSPLASRPPSPSREWLLLIDASGSMAGGTEDGRTRLEAAIDAAGAAAAVVPPADRLAVASFARELRAWPAREDRRAVPPPDLAASGPTNLRAALDAVIATRGGSGAVPLRVLLMSDGDADLGDVAALQRSLAAAAVTLDWVSLDAAGAEGTLARLVNATGGSIQRPGPAARWREATLAAVRAAEVIRVSDAAVPIMWRGRLADLGRMTADRANTTFMRGDAEVLAAREDSSAAPMAAEWRVGAGRVAALAFAAPLSVVERVASGIEPSPRDPRFVVKWESDRVTVEAADTVWPLDGLRIEMRRLDAPDAAAVALAQIAPGRYEASIPPSSQPRLLALNVGEQRIDAHAMVGMPEPEFQQTGINRSELERLAQRTGGRVIDADRGPHELLPSPRRRAPLAVPLLLIAVASLAGALVLCHRYGS